MVSPFAASPQGYYQPPVQGGASQQLPPKTSGALVFQIFNPVNYAEGVGPAPGANGAPADAFQRSAAINPNTPPQQQLVDAYNNALNTRNAAEQARNQYLQLANQLNGQAYQNQFGQPFQAPGQIPGQAQPGQQPNNPWAQWQQQQAALAQQQYQQQLQQMQQQQMLQQQQAAQQAQQQQQQAKQPPQQQGLANVPTEELNRMITQPKTLQEKVDAMEEIGVRGQGTPETYELLKQEALANTSTLPPGQAQDDANYVRQAALWTLGMLNKAQNSQAPTAQLPGLSAISQIISNRNENPDVKAAAVQALQVIDRPKDKTVIKILKKAARDKNPDVKRLAQEALSGKSIPLPNQQGGAAAQVPGM